MYKDSGIWVELSFGEYFVGCCYSYGIILDVDGDSVGVGGFFWGGEVVGGGMVVVVGLVYWFF